MTNLRNIVILTLYGIGFVISGEITGWHFGWNSIGMIGFFNLFSISAGMYLALSRVQIELGTLVPDATGPHSYTEKAFPKLNWLIRLTQFAIFVEFLFACPYISNTFGQYLSLALKTQISGEAISISTIVIIGFVRLFIPRLENILIVLITTIGIIELGYYFIKVYPHFHFNNITSVYENKSLTILDYAKELPTAMWMFLGIEGISLVFNSVTKNKSVDRKKNLSYSYYFSFAIIFILAFFVLLFTAGSVIWNSEVYIKFTDTNNLHPLPTVLKNIMGETHVYYILLVLGIFGLGASLVAILFASIDQLKLLSNNYFEKLNPSQWKKELLFTVITISLIILSIELKIQDHLIYISVFGAVIMYLIVAISLLYYRYTSKSETQFSKIISTIAAGVLALVSIVTIIGFCSSRPTYALIFFVLFLVYFLTQIFYSNGKTK